MNKSIRKLFLFFTILLFIHGRSQTTFLGKIINDEGEKQVGIQVHNMRTGLTVLSNSDGDFSIGALPGDEVRLISPHFVRTNIALKDEHFKNKQTIRLESFVKEIRGVKLDKISMKDKVAIMQKNIGLPPPPQKPRETPPPTAKDIGAFNYVRSNMNLNNLYKNLSGDARRMRSIYRYEDAEENIIWITECIGSEYFEENNIPKSRQKEFIQFVMGKEELYTFIKEKNIDAIKFSLSRYAPDFIKLIEKHSFK
ncbi:hypothetical protein HZQ14_19725 [Elizabethkingia anophelis]|uniref:hypothetical protein n=1 Tax=Elizabethkingia anophelis TaxID=1117645 RepID=UPI0021A8094A|nr:hypothetical protein [Elizabethkingia anophelis]